MINESSLAGGRMAGSKVGGSPAVISEAARGLHSAHAEVRTRPAGIGSATGQGATGCGDAHLATALSRFNAAYGQFVSDVAVELAALAVLADSASADLNKAGGE
jgi:hypothetical protein